MKKPIRFSALLASVLLVACSTPKHGLKTVPGGSSKPLARALPLTEEESRLRSQQIGRVSYNMWFGLSESSEEYESRVVIHFDLKPKALELGKDVFVDFWGGKIDTLSVNSESRDEKQIARSYDGQRITLALKDLKSGQNRIEIGFHRLHSSNGNGFHRFKDPVDGKVYLYTNFEPYNARQMFPCFDQPDIKASYELAVAAPEAWEVIANTEPREVAEVDGRKSWTFPPTPVFSTYLFALHAGPFAKWSADADGIPTRLYARKSLAKYVDHQEWLSVTARGLKFFNEFFDYPYPFAKYDQVIVPDFNAGAMENVGAVTFSERFIYRSRSTHDQRRGRADIILHEMAHMWFGNLVTMQWWNGLWLNESFATLMAAFAVDRGTDMKGSWAAFFNGMKSWAYREDQLVTTHPIEVGVRNTDEAFSIFDGITYGKGASALKQLVHFLGENNFRKGLQLYFKTHAYKNTTIDDFLGALSRASGRDLAEWQKQWLRTSGVNSASAQWACKSGKIAMFKIAQAPDAASKVLRPHRMNVALLDRHGGKLQVTSKLDVTYSAAETDVPQAIGRACPAAVIPNIDDHDYVKVEFDPQTLITLQKDLDQVSDPFLRQIVWSGLNSMVVDAKLAAQDYIDLVIRFAGKETNTLIIRDVVGNLSGGLGFPAYRRLAPELQESKLAEIEAFLRKGLLSAPAGSDLQTTWLRAFAFGAGATAESQKLMKDLLAGNRSLPGAKLGQDRRWELIQGLARNGASGAADLVASEKRADPSDNGQKEAIRAEASLPDPASKQVWLTRLLRRKEAPGYAALKYSDLRQAARGFHQPSQEGLSAEAGASFFAELKRIAKEEDEEIADLVASSVFPPLCSIENAARTESFLRANSDLPPYVIRALREGQQEEERCARARQKSRLVLEGTPVRQP